MDKWIGIEFALDLRMIKESIQRAGFLYRMLTQRKLSGLDLLEADHMRVELLYLRWRVASDVKRDAIFNSIKKELLEHCHVEESVLYPTCAKILELRRLVKSYEEQHKLIKALLNQGPSYAVSHAPNLSSTPSHIKMRILMEEFQHHIIEEENVLFPRIRMIMKKPQFDKLSRDIRMAKEGKHTKGHKLAA